jgi:hypothetical protein
MADFDIRPTQPTTFNQGRSPFSAGSENDMGRGIGAEPPAPPAAPDATAPVVAFISPSPGTAITPTTPIVFTVTDNLDELLNVSVDVTFPDGVSEMIFDGDTFSPLYAGVSTRIVIANGFQFTIRRKRGGWPATPTFNVEAIDADGNRSE